MYLYVNRCRWYIPLCFVFAYPLIIPCCSPLSSLLSYLPTSHCPSHHPSLPPSLPLTRHSSPLSFSSRVFTCFLLPWLETLPQLLVDLGRSSPALSAFIIDTLASTASYIPLTQLEQHMITLMGMCIQLGECTHYCEHAESGTGCTCAYSGTSFSGHSE